MGPGGAERVMSHLVGHLSSRHTVVLLTLEKPTTQSFYPLPSSIKTIQVDKLGNRGWRRPLSIASRFYAVRRAVQANHPDIVISFLDTMNITAIFSCLRTSVPVVVSQRNDPVHNNLGWVKVVLRNQSYSLARAIVVQTRRIAEYFPASVRSRIRIIANPVPPAQAIAEPSKPGRDGRFRLISVGRLVPQKGHGRLIDAFAKVAGNHPMWDLIILGEGPDRAALEAQVRRIGLEDRIRLPGTTTNVAETLAGSHLMAFPSVYEGFPNALAEGLAAGLPAIGHAGVSGVEDLIIDGTNGLLIDPARGEGGLENAISRLMADAPLRTRMGGAARLHVDQWAPERMFKLWDEVLAETVLDPDLRTQQSVQG